MLPVRIAADSDTYDNSRFYLASGDFAQALA